jgi:predicted DsbA family dithiol-disulfide isomerase
VLLSKTKEEKMKIEVWSDIMCPWCYIGKRRFERALDQFAEADKLEVEWKSFQLNPELKTDPSVPIHQYLSQKFGVDTAQALQMNQQVTSVAAGVGLSYQLDRAVLANTFKAHRLLHYAKSMGRQQEVKERLLRAYFTEGKNMDDVSVLAALAAEAGLDEATVKEVLATDAYVDAVRADIRESQQLGIRGVPFFVFDRKYGISGAQETRVFLETLEKSFAEWREDHPEIKLETTEGQSCTPDGNC